MPVLNTFNRTAIDALQASADGKRQYFNDPKTPGLQLVVTEQGSKSFYLYRRINRRPKRKFLGKYPAMTPEIARRRATTLLGKLSLGIDIEAEEHQENSRKITLSEAYIAFKRIRSRLRPSTLVGYTQIVEKGFTTWKNRPLVSITKQMVSDRHREMTDKNGPAYADGAMRFLRALMNFANAHYEGPDGTPLLTDNPVRRLSQTRQWNRVKRRSTVLKVDHLKPWFTAVLALKQEPTPKDVIESQANLVADYLLLLICTGLRRSEAAGLTWNAIDFGNKTFTIQETKNGESHTLPMSDYVQELLEARQRIIDGRFVFPGPSKRGFLIEPRPQMKKVTAASGVTFVLHDLRRTFVTVADALDLSSYALKRLINHKMSGDVTAGYVISDVERLRSPMQRITDFLLEKAGIRPKPKTGRDRESSQTAAETIAQPESRLLDGST
jgi:integrase